MTRVSRQFYAFVSLLLVISQFTFACKPIKQQAVESDLESVSACTVWPAHFMVTKGNIPVFESAEALEDNQGAQYVGKNTPVIRELTILNEEKNARLMKIVVRGGTLAGEKRWWTLASNLESRSSVKCPKNTPRKCSEDAVHFCDGTGCQCIYAGAAPNDILGNLALDVGAFVGVSAVKAMGFLMITRISAVRLLSSAASSTPTTFASGTVNLTTQVASESTLLKAEEFIATRAMHSFKFARELLGKNPYYKKLDASEISAINYYTGVGYGEINQALRAGNLAELERLKPVIEAASSGLVKMSEKAFTGTVYRGVSLSKEVSAVYAPGAHVTEVAFTSTTRSAAEKFAGNTIFQIASKTGRMIDDVSHFTKEAEVLFPPGTVFRVVSKGLVNINGREVTKIVMQQVGKGIVP